MTKDTVDAYSWTCRIVRIYQNSPNSKKTSSPTHAYSGVECRRKALTKEWVSTPPPCSQAVWNPFLCESHSEKIRSLPNPSTKKLSLPPLNNVFSRQCRQQIASSSVANFWQRRIQGSLYHQIRQVYSEDPLLLWDHFFKCPILFAKSANQRLSINNLTKLKPCDIRGTFMGVFPFFDKPLLYGKNIDKDFKQRPWKHRKKGRFG